MSIRVMTQVWDDSPYEGTRLLIHLAMADHANEEGWFFCAQTSLANKARCSVEYVRKTVSQMIDDGVLVIERKGSSRGRATEYRLLPNRVGQSSSLTTESDSPTLIDQLPNSDSPTPQLSSVPTVLSNRLNTTESDSQAIALEVSKAWWDKQEPKPLGKAAWFVLLRVTQAAAVRGFTSEQILTALDAIGTVPSMQQLDKQLRGITYKSARHQRLGRGVEAINNATLNGWEIEA